MTAKEQHRDATDLEAFEAQENEVVIDFETFVATLESKGKL